jgi:hypothetical protein
VRTTPRCSYSHSRLTRILRPSAASDLTYHSQAWERPSKHTFARHPHPINPRRTVTTHPTAEVTNAEDRPAARAVLKAGLEAGRAPESAADALKPVNETLPFPSAIALTTDTGRKGRLNRNRAAGRVGVPGVVCLGRDRASGFALLGLDGVPVAYPISAQTLEPSQKRKDKRSSPRAYARACTGVRA